jgi:hypothetical protein
MQYGLMFGVMLILPIPCLFVLLQVAARLRDVMPIFCLYHVNFAYMVSCLMQYFLCEHDHNLDIIMEHDHEQ